MQLLIDWLQQHSTLLGLILSLLTTIGVFLGPRLAEKLRQQHEQQREYRHQLKQFVVEPIKQRLEEYYLPVLRNERPIVGIVTELIPKEHARLEEASEVPRQHLSIIELEDQPNAPTTANYYRQTTPKFDEPKFLWRNARKQFPKFFKSWDEFSAAFRAYGQACLQEIHRMRQQILESCKLKEFTLDFPKPPWVNALWLGWYSFFRVIGLEAAQRITLDLEDKTTYWALVSQHSASVAEGSKDEVQACLRIANDMAETAQWKTETELARHRLLDQADVLLEEVRRLMLEES